MVARHGLTEIEAELAKRGLVRGVGPLVERWRQHVETLQNASLTWEHQPSSLYPPRQQAPHDHGIFTVDAMDHRGEWVLRHEWPGWGWRELGRGSILELKTMALQLVRAGGPFGGAERIFRQGRPRPRCAASGMVRHAAADGELRTREFVRGLPVLLHIKCDGTFAYRLHDAYTLDDDVPAKLVERLGEVEVLVLGGQRVPWTFTEVWPLLGTIHTPGFDLLSCWLASDEVAVIAVTDVPQGALVGSWAQIRELDVDRWLSSLREQALASAVPTSPPAAPPSPAASSSDPPRPYALSPAKRSPPVERVEPAQRSRLPAELGDALAAYFAVVEGALPTRQTGAEFARELAWALVRAATAGATTMTGAPAELFAVLHRHGYLRAVPSDQVGRDALKLLAAHTPLVRRLHYRRWCLAFGDLLDPQSPLRVALRRYEQT